mgnify:CR=1 FL=1
MEKAALRVVAAVFTVITTQRDRFAAQHATQQAHMQHTKPAGAMRGKPKTTQQINEESHT